MESNERSETSDGEVLVRIRGVAHDLANLLVSVHGGVEIATLEESAEGRQRWLYAARVACGRAAELVEQLSLLSYGEELSREQLAPGETVEDFIVLVRGVSDPGVSYTFQGRPTRPIVANRSQLGQVVLNLLINARDAVTERASSEPGHAPRVLVEMYDGDAPGDAPKGQRAVILKVVDNGKGISPQLIGRVFDPLVTTKPLSRGSGLGLSTTRRIVTEHGGGVSVKSTLDVGTTFTAWFPASQGLRARGA